MKIPEGYIQDERGLWLRPAFLNLSEFSKSRICNGIGAASGLSKHLPSTIWGLDCRVVGDIHDYDYYIGGTVTDRRIADLVFLHNLYVVINEGVWILKGVRKMRARTYFAALRLGGFLHFSYKNDACKAADQGEKVESYPTFEEEKAPAADAKEAQE